MIVCCSYCGKALLRDDARFCSQCGTALISSSSLSRQENPNTSAPWLENTDKRQRVLREQIAQQPFSHSQSQPSNHAITMRLQDASPITPIPVSVSHKFAEEINTPIPKKTLPIVVVRENTPRPITLTLTPLPAIERSEKSVEQSKKPYSTQSAKKSQAHRISGTSTTQIRRLSWFEIICVLVAFLIMAGSLIWFLYTSSKSDALVNPTQNFTDTRMGITLQYPNQWIETSDPAQSTISFYDNINHTTQITVGMYRAGIDVAQFMQKQALQFEMTKGQFGMSMPFADITWQELQGQRVEEGANYTGEILAALYRQHLYMITQFAPQGVYATEEKLIFTPFCMSFHFL